MKKDPWKWIERIISITVILGLIIAWQRDKAVWDTKLEILIENDTQRTEYWKNQNEINGKFLILYDHFIFGGAGARTETEEGH